MAITIAMLRAAGASDEVIVKVLELDQADELERQAAHREANRIANREYRARKKSESYQQARDKRDDHADHAHHATVDIPQQNGNGETGTKIAQEESYLQTQKVRKKDKSGAHRIAVDWKPTEADRDWSIKHGMTLTEIQGQADDFLDYWKARGGEKARKTDWEATWRRWCRTFLDQHPRQLSFNGGRTQEAIEEDRRRGEYYMAKRKREAEERQHAQTH